MEIPICWDYFRVLPNYPVIECVALVGFLGEGTVPFVVRLNVSIHKFESLYLLVRVESTKEHAVMFRFSSTCLTLQTCYLDNYEW